MLASLEMEGHGGRINRIPLCLGSLQHSMGNSSCRPPDPRFGKSIAGVDSKQADAPYEGNWRR